ncbi:unnamed protein product [Kuraishia capsulata CBS 1993]|uniref:UBC core domain-containing protein n=1 Tax=Kuraishia capsulata CBS 1993 TaxID=1382522 RepID=W6MTF2_9ASCO|nr:uncharacterized protein KUCA_T00000982001 [Kuraishia capsulata CBS 1993]CDK25015.1 unnamed protein product [Kuraishia capsulata CBS 1993]
MSEKRLLKELRTISKELVQEDSSLALNGVLVLEPVSEGDLFEWRARIRGPEGSCYANGIWDLHITVPSNYPTAPPTFRFVMSSERNARLASDSPTATRGRCLRMPHPNVNFETGEICLDILQQMWTPAWSLSSSVVAIVMLLDSPEPLSPLNIDLANLLKSGDQKGYDDLVKYYIERFTIAES